MVSEGCGILGSGRRERIGLFDQMNHGAGHCGC
jgi:hypothetical protein